MVTFMLRDRISTIVDAYDKADAIEQGHKYLENCFTSRFQITSVLREHGHAGNDTMVIELTNQGVLNPEDLMDLNPELKDEWSQTKAILKKSGVIREADKYAQTKARMNIGGVNLREKENE